jgi:hypothetical protein
VADEPVVVLKFQPEKPGDGVEDKTETTGSLSVRAIGMTKSSMVAKEGSLFERTGNRKKVSAEKKLSELTGKGHKALIGGSVA